jgi:hypothetical protein
MKLTHLFCDGDDFCRTFIVDWQKNQLIQGEKKRHRPHRMSYSEMITILVSYHQSGFRTFKWFYLKHVQCYWQSEFPNLLSYNRFIELMPELLAPITAFMNSRRGVSAGIAFVDSTPPESLQEYPYSTAQNLRQGSRARQVIDRLVLWL